MGNPGSSRLRPPTRQKNLLRACISTVMKDSCSFKERKSWKRVVFMNLKSGSVICQRLSADRSVPECSEQPLKKTILKCSSCAILYCFSRTFRPSLPATVQTAGHRTNIRPHKFPSAHCRVVHASANNKTKDSENYANALKVSNLRSYLSQSPLWMRTASQQRMR